MDSPCKGDYKGVPCVTTFSWDPATGKGSVCDSKMPAMKAGETKLMTRTCTSSFNKHSGTDGAIFFRADGGEWKELDNKGNECANLRLQPLTSSSF